MNLIERFNALKTDREKWLLVIEHSRELTVMLDNDETFVVMTHSPDNFDSGRFRDSVGDMPGIGDLFEAIGINGEGV